MEEHMLPVENMPRVELPMLLERPFNLTKYVTNYRYYLNNLIPNKSVQYEIHFLGENEVVVNISVGIIEGEEYEKWGADDAYIKDLVHSKAMEQLKEI